MASNNVASQYEFTDAAPLNGLNYYRLEQRDLDGTTTLSGVISITTTPAGNLGLFPNPAEGVLNVRFATERQATATIFNAAGQQQFQVTLTEGNLPMDVSKLTSGLYLITVTDGEATVTKRFIKR